MFAKRDKQIAVACLRDTATIGIARGQRSFLPEDDFDVVEPAIGVVQLCPRHRGTAPATGSLGIAEINRPVLRKGFVQDDVEQSALARGPDLGDAFQRRRKLPLPADYAPPPPAP